MKTLLKLKAKHPEIIEDVWDEGEDGYWISLHPGWSHYIEALHHRKGETMKELVQWFKEIEPCDCEECLKHAAQGVAQELEETTTDEVLDTFEAQEDVPQPVADKTYLEKLQEEFKRCEADESVDTLTYDRVRMELKVEAKLVSDHHQLKRGQALRIAQKARGQGRDALADRAMAACFEHERLQEWSGEIFKKIPLAWEFRYQEKVLADRRYIYFDFDSQFPGCRRTRDPKEVAAYYVEGKEPALAWPRFKR